MYFLSFYEQINTETFEAHVGKLGMCQRACICVCVCVSSACVFDSTYINVNTA